MKSKLKLSIMDSFFGNKRTGRGGGGATKTVARREKHANVTVQCSATNASGGRCGLKRGHDGYHRNVRGNTVMQTYGTKSKSKRYTPYG